MDKRWHIDEERKTTCKLCEAHSGLEALTYLFPPAANANSH